MNVTQRSIQSGDRSTSIRSAHASSRSRGVAIVMVIVCVAVAAVIGSAYVASQLNAPQIVDNVNDGIEARYLADSGADLATAIMECETIDWRAATATGGILVDNLPIGHGTVSITVKNAAGDNPDSTTEYPIIVSKGTSDNMRQTVGMQVHAPLPSKTSGHVDVDLSEFAAFANSSINVDSGWIAGWGASPRAAVGLPVKVGTNAITNGAIRIKDSTAAPDAVGYVMATAPVGTITDAFGGPAPIRRVDYSNNETVMLPTPPTPNYSGLAWALSKTPTITSNTSILVDSDRRYNSITVDLGATLTIDLAGGNRTVAISGPLVLQNRGVLQINNGHLDLVVTGPFGMSTRSVVALGPGASLSIWLGGHMSIDDSVIGLPADFGNHSRQASKGLAEYYDPSLCTIYRLTSINSIDLTPLDADNATAWVWSDNAIKSWIFTTDSFVCARLYGPTKAAVSVDTGSAVFGNVVANTIDIANLSAIYYDHALDSECGYTTPDSALFAAPLDLRDDVRLLLTDLNDSTVATVLALLNVAPGPTPFDPFGPTHRSKKRVASRAWKYFGQKIKRDRKSTVDVVAETK